MLIVNLHSFREAVSVTPICFSLYCKPLTYSLYEIYWDSTVVTVVVVHGGTALWRRLTVHPVLGVFTLTSISHLYRLAIGLLHLAANPWCYKPWISNLERDKVTKPEKSFEKLPIMLF